MSHKHLDTTTDATATPRRRGMHLRVFMLAIVVIAVPFAWVVNRARERNAAVETVQRAGGFVLFDYQWNAWPSAAAMSPVPSWLIRLFGVAMFHDVVYVGFVGSEHDQNVLASLARFDKLQGFAASLRDEELAFLSGLRRLEILRLSGSPITDAGLIHLRGLKNLRELEITSTAVGDDGMTELARHRRLELLEIADTRVTDVGLERLRPIEGLTSLSLAVTNITDVGLKGLIAFRQLKSLGLNETKVSSAAIDSIRREFRTKYGTKLEIVEPDGGLR
jgi:hypothetical protein